MTYLVPVARYNRDKLSERSPIRDSDSNLKITIQTETDTGIEHVLKSSQRTSGDSSEGIG